jgi:FkbM family methyltransferase
MVGVNKIKEYARRFIRSLGYDIVSYPIGDWLTFREHLTNMLSKFQINCVLDVGAHRGEYASFLRSLGYEGNIISFEPIAENFKVLLDKSSRDQKWKVLNFGLGKSNISMPINVTRFTQLSSFLTTNASEDERFGNNATVDRREIVVVKRLDSIWSELFPEQEALKIFLKIDTQGYDLFVLEGMGVCLDKLLALQTEMSVIPIYENMPNFLDAISFLKKKGFDITGMYPICRDGRLRVIEFDCVMLRNGQ